MTAGTATAEVVASRVAAAKLRETAVMVGVATTATTVVAAAGVARRVLLPARDAAKGSTIVDTTGAVAAALGEAPVGRGTAYEVVRRETARPPPPLVFGLEHGPRGSGRRKGQEVIYSFPSRILLSPLNG